MDVSQYASLRSFLGGWGQVQKLFGAYLFRQLSELLEVQSYLFVLNSATFGASFALFGPFRAIRFVLWGYFWGRSQVQNIFGTY